MNISSVDRTLFVTSVSLISSLIGSDITRSEFKITLWLRSISVWLLLRSPFTADLDEAFECLAEAELLLGAGAGAGAGLSLTSRDWAVVSGSDSAPAVAVSAPAVAVAELLLGAGLVLSSSEVTVSRPPEAVSRVVAASVSASSVATEVTLSTEVVASTGPALLVAGLVLRTSDELVLATASLVAGLLVVT